MKHPSIIIIMLLALLAPLRNAMAADNDLAGRLESQARDARRAFRELRDLQRTLDRLSAEASRNSRLNDRADSEIKKLRDAKKLNDKLSRIKRERGDLAVTNDPELSFLREQLRLSRIALKKARENDKIRREIERNRLEIGRLQNAAASSGIRSLPQ